MLLSVAGRALARVTARARIYSPGAASVALALGLFGGVGALSVAISEEKVYESKYEGCRLPLHFMPDAH